MEKILCLVAVALVSGLARVSSLECYVCVDCPNPTNDDLQTCAETIPPTITPTTTLSTPTTSSSTSKSTSSTTTTRSTSTAASTSSSTSTSTSTSPTTTTISTTTTTTSPTTTTTSPTTTTTSPTTTTTSPTTTTTSPTTTTTLPTEQSPKSNDEETRSRRSILSIINHGGCDCSEDNCDCSGGSSSNRIAQYADDFVCVKATMTVNGTAIMVRDCAYANNTDGLNPCEEIKDITEISGCSICNSDKCNSTTTLQYSSFMTLAFYIFNYILK